MSTNLEEEWTVICHAKDDNKDVPELTQAIYDAAIRNSLGPRDVCTLFVSCAVLLASKNLDTILAILDELKEAVLATEAWEPEGGWPSEIPESTEQGPEDMSVAHQKRAVSTGGSTLAEFIAALGWQGGTIHQALAEVRRLRAVDPKRCIGEEPACPWQPKRDGPHTVSRVMLQLYHDGSVEPLWDYSYDRLGGNYYCGDCGIFFFA